MTDDPLVQLHRQIADLGIEVTRLETDERTSAPTLLAWREPEHDVTVQFVLAKVSGTNYDTNLLAGVRFKEREVPIPPLFTMKGGFGGFGGGRVWHCPIGVARYPASRAWGVPPVVHRWIYAGSPLWITNFGFNAPLMTITSIRDDVARAARGDVVTVSGAPADWVHAAARWFA